MVAGLSVRWAVFQTADACLSLLCCLPHLKKKKHSAGWCVTSSLPSILSPQQCLASLPPSSSSPVQTWCLHTQTKKQRGCVQYIFNQTFSPPRLPHYSSSYLWFEYNNNSSEQLYKLPPSINSRNTGGTSEALPQKQLTRLLKFVSLLPGFRPPHYWITLSCLPFSAHKRTKTAQSKRRSSV